MKWIKITAVFIGLLLFVNMFLVYNLYIQYINISRIDPKSIDITVELLKKTGINISHDMIPDKKPNYKIYEGSFFNILEDYYINTAMHLSCNNVADDFTLHMINNGIKIIEKNNNEVFEFYNDNIFSFKYMSDRQLSTDLYAYIKKDSEKIYDVQRNNKDNIIYRKIEDLINAKFFFDFSEKYKTTSKNSYMRVEVKKIYYNSIQNVYYTECVQKLEGLEIYPCEVVCVIFNDEIIYAQGIIIFYNIGSSYHTELYDQISVLFNEKAYIEQQRNELAAKERDSDISDAALSEGAEIQNITDLKCVYNISWNTERSKYYLIPSWYIEYNGNIAKIRNAVN